MATTTERTYDVATWKLIAEAERRAKEHFYQRLIKIRQIGYEELNNPDTCHETAIYAIASMLVESE
jgi:hypothetical protein